MVSFCIQGCVPMISQCNGECPLMVATATKNNNKTKLIISSTSTTTRSTTLQNWSTTNTKVWALTDLSFKSRKKLFQEAESYERRVMCGNSCLTREEAKHKYHCGGHCQVLSGLYFANLLKYKISGKIWALPIKRGGHLSPALPALRPGHLYWQVMMTWSVVTWCPCIGSRIVTLSLWLCPDGLRPQWCRAALA